jgi:hypothetical protein
MRLPCGSYRGTIVSKNEVSYLAENQQLGQRVSCEIVASQKWLKYKNRKILIAANRNRAVTSEDYKRWKQSAL